MRIRFLTLGMTAIAAAFLTTGAFGLDVALKYEKMETTFPSCGFGYTEATMIKPSGGWKLPVLATDKPYYALLSLGDKKHLLILDKKNSEEKSYSRLWIDRNGDGDLTDEKPIDYILESRDAAGKKYFTFSIPPVDMTVTVDGIELPYRIMPRPSDMMMSQARERTIFQYDVLCGYRGEFTVGASRYLVRLYDSNGNGRFGDRKELYPGKAQQGSMPYYTLGDMMYISDGKNKEYKDSQPLGDLFLLGDSMYHVKVEVPNGRMTLTETKGDRVPLKLGARPERLSLITRDGTHCLMVYKPPADVIRIPAGSYRLLFYQLFQKDAQGDIWRLMADGSDESPPVTVAPGNGAALPFGEPFVPVVTLYPIDETSDISKGDTRLSFSIEGRGKEMVTDISHFDGDATQIPLSKTKNHGEFPRDPSYTIVKTDGEIVAKGSFEYG